MSIVSYTFIPCSNQSYIKLLIKNWRKCRLCFKSKGRLSKSKTGKVNYW